MQKKVTIKTPSWVAEDDVFSLLRQELQMKLAYYESHCRMFEHKYGQTFDSFESTIRSAKKESFQKWEDFMDWETAHSACLEMKQRLQELATWKT